MSVLSSIEKACFGKHPRGLPMLFMAEFWERFSFYGMRALLVLYMTKAMLDPTTGAVFTEDSAYAVYGAYGALVYAFPVLGGFLADRFLGYRRAIGLGGMLMAIGHFLMAIEDSHVFFLALAFLCVGNGFFKPNISSTVGTLYKEGDPRRDAGFTIFYMGINFGALLSPIVCGPLGEKVSWHLGFSLAGIGMCLGLWMFVGGRGRLDGHGEAPNEEAIHRRTLGLKNLHLCWLACIVITPAIALLLNFNEILEYILYAVGAVILFTLIVTAIRSPRVWRHRLIVLIVLMFFHSLFWAFFEQAGSSMTTLTDRHIDRVAFNSEITNDDVGTTIEDFAVTQEHWNRKFANVEVTPDHVEAEMSFSGFTIDEAFVGTEFKNVQVEFDFGGVVFKDRTIIDEDVGKTFGDLEITLASAEGDEGTTTPAAESETRKLADIEIGPAPFGTDFKNTEVESNHLGGKITAIGGGPAFKSLVVEARHVGLEIERATVTEGQVGKAFSQITITAADSDAGKVLKSVTLDQSHVGMGSGGAEWTASMGQFINPFFIVLLAPFFSMMWTGLGRRRRDPSTPMKFALAMFQIGLAFYLLSIGTGYDIDGRIAASWLVLLYLLQTTGELCISPVGLSAVTRLAPSKIVAFAMGSWFLTIAFAHHFAAQIAKLTTGNDTDVAADLTPTEQLAQFGSVYETVGFTALGAGALLVLLTPVLRKLMHEGVHADEETGEVMPLPGEDTAGGES